MEEKKDPQEEAKNKKKQKLNAFLSKYFNLVIIIVMLIILIVSFFLLIKPKYKSILDSIQSNVYQKEKIYLQQYKKLNESKQLISLYKSFDVQGVEKINNIIPKSYIKEDLFTELENIVVSNGFILKSIQIDLDMENVKKNRSDVVNINNPVLPPEIDQIRVHMSVGSMDYYGLKYLIKVLENNLKLMDIVDLDFNPESSILKIEFWTYYLKDSN